MRRYQLAGAAIAGILFIGSNAAAAYATIQSPATGRNAPGFHLAEGVVQTKEQKKFLAVQLLCPDSDAGVLTVVSKNRNGITDHYLVGHVHGKQTYLSIYQIDNEGTKKGWIEVDLLKNTDKEVLELGNAMAEDGISLLKTICNGSEIVRKRYRATLKANLHTLGLPAAEYPSNF